MAEKQEKERFIKPPSMTDALIPIITLLILLVGAVYLYRGDATGGPFQIALILASIVAGLVAHKNGFSYEEVSKSAINGVSIAMGAIFILLAVGSLIGVWSMSGTIATMVYYGIQFLNPHWFYLASVIICALVALGIGSAWTVAGTLGVGLVGIAIAIGADPAITAGAVISGSYFGDKMSPLSETTNLTPAVAGTDLITHIKAMMATTVPSILITMVIYAVIGLRANIESAIDLTVALDAISSVYRISLWTLLPLLLVVVLAFRRFPPTASIIAGALLGGLIAIIFQPQVVLNFVNEPELSTPWAMIKGIWSSMASGFAIDTGYPALDMLFSRGGMSSMLTTVWLIISAMGFGGVMEHSGMLARLIQPLIKRAKHDRSLLIYTGLTAIGINVVAADQYMAIVLTGNMYRGVYKQRGIAPQTLSRQIEDTATVTSPLVPWNSCGAYMSATLGIATVAYFPFTFFNLINPLLSFVYALVGFRIQHVEEPHEVYGEVPRGKRLHGVGGHSIDEMAPTEVVEDIVHEVKEEAPPVGV
ncbi:MAG TPA: Na+/H+ antiporter NhaC [Caldilineae bacterium]|nr:Na+/H+ antiporter NhaC [Caldilineae bacterium]